MMRIYINHPQTRGSEETIKGTDIGYKVTVPEGFRHPGCPECIGPQFGSVHGQLPYHGHDGGGL